MNFDSSTRMVPAIFSQRHGKLLWFQKLENTVSLYYIRDEFIAPIPEAERKDLILAYHAQLNSVDEDTRITAAKAWSKWE